MNQLLIILILACTSSSFAFAADKTQLSLAFNALSVGRSSVTVNPVDLPSSTNRTSYVDTLGMSGSAAQNPWFELGVRVNRFAGYAYPFLADKRREIWLGAVLDDYLEAGVVFSHQSQQFSNPQDLGLDVKTRNQSQSSFGLFYRQKFLLLSQTIESKVRATANVADAGFEDPTFDRKDQGYSLQGEMAWVWEVSQHLELTSGIGLSYEKLSRRQGGTAAGSVSGYDVSAQILRAVVLY